MEVFPVLERSAYGSLYLKQYYNDSKKKKKKKKEKKKKKKGRKTAIICLLYIPGD